VSRPRRRQHVPWNAAGRAAENPGDGDSVVRDTGWVFNNATGDHLTLAEFVNSGEQEVGAYLEFFGFHPDENAQRSMVDIGSGIGRMTAGFTRRFRSVVAADLDAAFLERCRETVARFGVPDRLSTSHVGDGRTLNLPDSSADLVFSYITLQHCEPADALALTTESLRVVKPGGHVVLNYRTWIPDDVVLFPAGVLVRALWRVPKVGAWLARQRWSTRLGWQANRLAPKMVFEHLAAHGVRLDEPAVWLKTSRRIGGLDGVPVRTFVGVDRSHWWLIARRAS
jgi:SAM-dependent methyltransferase